VQHLYRFLHAFFFIIDNVLWLPVPLKRGRRKGRHSEEREGWWWWLRNEIGIDD
jgi:drug/metabolite transporter (DMT)-like permease